MSFLVLIMMYFSVGGSVEGFLYSSALCYNSKISQFSINLGCRLKKIDTEMSLQSSGMCYIKF